MLRQPQTVADCDDAILDLEVALADAEGCGEITRQHDLREDIAAYRLWRQHLIPKQRQPGD